MSNFQMSTNIAFTRFELSGNDCIKFLQGQVTCNVVKLGNDYQTTAVCNIKGKVHFGLWIKKISDTQFDLILSEDLADDFANHVKKYGAFSKVSLSEPSKAFPTLIDNVPSFSTDKSLANPEDWSRRSIEVGNFWIVQNTQELFQPQELRLHQLGGVNYDKGCYLGQEVIARMYFKSAPKAYLHRIRGVGDLPKSGEGIGEKSKVLIVNAIHTTQDKQFEALVVSRPELLDEFEILNLPPELMKSVARNG